MRMIRFLCALVISLAAPALALAAEGPIVQAPHMELQLVSAGAAPPGQTVQVALRMKPDTDWHSFWRNPGDAGEPTRLQWTLPAGWSAGKFTWPLPKTLMVGGILMNYVYEPEVAAKIALYVNYLSPCKGVKEIVEKQDPKLAANPLVFPPDEILKKLHPYPALSTNDERTMKEAMAQVTGA